MKLRHMLPFLFLAACGRALGVPELVDGATTNNSPHPVGGNEPGGTTCGGSAGTPCRGDLFCDFPSGCGGREAIGVCTERPVDCTGANDKQSECGCDGVTYVNDCLRRQAGVSLAHTSACEVPPPRQPCDFPTRASCEANSCRWFICGPTADCPFDQKCIPDCRTTGCDPGKHCDTCESQAGANWICITDGGAC
jgi:hypothetical protein